MTEVQLQEFKLDPDSELRFEVESKNEKVVLEVNSSCKPISKGLKNRTMILINFSRISAKTVHMFNVMLHNIFPG